MSLNISNELEKTDINARLSEHFIFFCNEFNKFSNTRARMLNSVYRMT